MREVDLIEMVKDVHNQEMRKKWTQMEELGGEVESLKWMLSANVLTPSEVQNLADRLRTQKKSILARIEEIEENFSDQKPGGVVFDKLYRKSEAFYESSIDEERIRATMGVVLGSILILVMIFIMLHIRDSGILSIAVSLILLLGGCYITGTCLFHLFENEKMKKQIPELAKKRATEGYNSILKLRIEDMELCKLIDSYLNTIREHT